MDTQDLIPKVIKAMQTSRQVRPMVYIELDAGTAEAYPLFNFVGEARAKAHMLFVAGREAGQKLSNRELLETCFVSEVWLTQGLNPTPGRRPPANVPQIEAVMFAIAKNDEPYQTLVKVYQIKRDKSKKPTELVYLNESTDPQGLMGLAFIAGWKSREMSEEEVRAKQPQGMRAFLAL